MITENGDKSYWTRIGAAFTNRDGSLAVQLDALPGPRARVQIRDYTPRDADAQDGPEGEGRAVAGGRAAHREARDGARRRDARASELSP